MGLEGGEEESNQLKLMCVREGVCVRVCGCFDVTCFDVLGSVVLWVDERVCDESSDVIW